MEIKETYRHYKGNNYEVIGEAIDNLTKEEYIFYRQLYYPFGFWIRPRDMFLWYKYDADKRVKCFTRIADSQKDSLTNVDLKEIEISHSETKVIYRIVGELDGKHAVEECRWFNRLKEDIMQLCDKDIFDALQRGELIFLGMNKNYPFIPEKQVQPASIDLRLGNRFVRFKENIDSFDIHDIENIDSYLDEVFLEEKQGYVIPPHEVVYCHVYEQMSIGDCYSARIEGRSRVARLGLSIHCTGDYINPGFMGSMPLQIVNHNYFPITVYPYMSICQIIIYELAQQPLITYAEKSTLPTNKYYNEKYPSPSILSCDENSTSDLLCLAVEEKFRKLIHDYNASFSMIIVKIANQVG